MIQLFFLPFGFLYALTLGLIIVLMVQMMCFVFGFFRFQYKRKNLWRSLFCAAGLVYLFLLLVYASEVCYNQQEGFAVFHDHLLLRWGLWVVLAVLAGRLFFLERKLTPLWIPATAALTLPSVEHWSGPAFPALLSLALVLWFVGATGRLIRLLRMRHHHLSAYSVKEAVDSMNFGILLFSTTPRADGQILLTNQAMQDLMFTLTGELPYNGKKFWETLEQGQVLSSCSRSQTAYPVVYTLPDGQVWRFELQQMPAGAMHCAILTASNMTERKGMTDQLRHHDRELQERNRSLAELLQNMEQVCLTEETLRAKNRVHDLLGQRISLFLRSVREHRDPDDSLLQSFANGLPEELRDISADTLESLQAIARSYQSLGVEVMVTGTLPPDEQQQKAMIEIAAEAMTNAVRHGCATRIHIILRPDGQLWEMRILDNGTCKEETIKEGGGLTGMRRRVTELGGQFSYRAGPGFEILVQLPGGSET